MISAGKAPLLPSISHLLPPAPTVSSVANCKSPHPIRARLWWHPLGEILIEICLWPARPSLTWLVFAQVSLCFLCSQTHSFCCSCISLLAASAPPPPCPPPSTCQAHLETFADALPPSVFLTLFRSLWSLFGQPYLNSASILSHSNPGVGKLQPKGQNQSVACFRS